MFSTRLFQASILMSFIAIVMETPAHGAWLPPLLLLVSGVVFLVGCHVKLEDSRIYNTIENGITYLRVISPSPSKTPRSSAEEQEISTLSAGGSNPSGGCNLS